MAEKLGLSTRAYCGAQEENKADPNFAAIIAMMKSSLEARTTTRADHAEGFIHQLLGCQLLSVLLQREQF